MRRDENGPRLVAPLEPSTYPKMADEPILMAVPDHKDDFTKGYVWVGDDRGHCYGHIPVNRFLALADAIRGKKGRAR